MSLEQIEPQENQPQEQPQQAAAPKSYNPFISPVSEKPYSQINVEVSQDKMYAPIPEPVVQGASVSGSENAYNMLNNDMGMGGAPSGNAGAAPFNPAMNKLSDKDTKMGAEHLSGLILDGYEQLHEFGNKWLQISQKKIRKMQAEGEIDLSVQIPYDYGQTLTAGEFIETFNEQNKDALSVTKEFKKEVKPILTRVLAKHGAGLTDEQMLMFLFGKDIFVKGIIVYQIKSTTNEMLNVIKEYTTALRENGGIVTPQQAASQETPKPPTPPEAPSQPKAPKPKPTPTPAAAYDSDDFNFRTNEVVIDSAVQKHQVPESGKARLMAQRKREREIEAAMKRASQMSGGGVSAYEQAMKSKKTGKRGRKPKDYMKNINEAEIAEAIVLSETKKTD